jgi:hypothetical protein
LAPAETLRPKPLEKLISFVMLFIVQMTLRIQDDLYREAKTEAHREGVTLTGFIESALRLRLQKSRMFVSGKPHPFPIYEPASPLRLSSEELKRFSHEEEFRHDLKKLRTS